MTTCERGTNDAIRFAVVIASEERTKQSVMHNPDRQPRRSARRLAVTLAIASEERTMQSVPAVLASEERTCLTVGKRSNPSSQHRQASVKSAARHCVLKFPGAWSLLISKQPDLYAAITNSVSLRVISVSLCVTIKRCVTLWLNSTPTDSFGTL